MTTDSDQAIQTHEGENTGATPAEAHRLNHTGLPDRLKTGIEALSGISLDGVKIHYNSSRPRQFNALAYAQGTTIHVGPGQERHLPHEAWHLVQQAQGRVQSTRQMQGGVPVNDDGGLEHEADVMGARALSVPVRPRRMLGEPSQQGAVNGREFQGQTAESLLDAFVATSRSAGGASAIRPIQAKFSTLAPSQQQQVEAKAEADYYEHAGRFEVALGREIAHSSEANDTAEDMLARVRRLVDAWAVSIKADRDQTYLDIFGNMSAQDTGSIPRIAEDIKDVFKGGSLRERLTLIYSAIRSGNLEKLLRVAHKDISSTGNNTVFKLSQKIGSTDVIVDSQVPKGFAKKAGLDKHLKKNTLVTSDIAARTHPDQPVNDRSALFARGQKITDLERTGEKQHTGGEDDTGQKKWATHQTLGDSNLSERELRNQMNDIRRQRNLPPLTKDEAAAEAKRAGMKPIQWLEKEYKTGLGIPNNKNAATPTLWVSGENWYRAQVDSKTQAEADKVKAKLRASISGTTDMYLHAAQYLGMASSEELTKVRLAMLAWMLPARDHSLYEIIVAATQYGLTDFDPSAPAWKNYEKPITPLGKSINTRAAKSTPPLPLGLPGKFPGWYLSPPDYPLGKKEESYKDRLADRWLGKAIPGVEKVRSDDEMSIFLACGAPRNLINRMSDPEWNAAKLLLAEVQKAKMDGDDKAKLAAFNRLAGDMVNPALQPLVQSGAANTLLVAFMHHKAPGFVLPETYKPFLTHARLLTPMAAGKRLSDGQIGAMDPAENKALINPEIGSKESGRRQFNTAYSLNKAKFIEDVLEYQPDKFRANPKNMNAWFETYGRKLKAAYPDTDIDHLRALNTARITAKGTLEEPKVEKAFDDAYQKVFQMEKLTEQERIALNLYSVSAVANDVNKASRGDAAALKKSGDTAELILSALEKMSPWTGGPVYRGDKDRGYAVGRVINYNEFVSTAKTVKSSFINKSGMGWATYALVIEKHKSGKDIMAFSNYSFKDLEKMEGEILFPPGVRFVVKRIEDWTHLKSPLADLNAFAQHLTNQIKAAQQNGQDTTALEAQKRQIDEQRKNLPADKQLINKVWVFMDEV